MAEARGTTCAAFSVLSGEGACPVPSGHRPRGAAVSQQTGIWMVQGASSMRRARCPSLLGHMRSSMPNDLLQVSRLAGALAALGVTKGDRVLIYMPLIPETIIAMLATVRLGAIHSVVFGGEWFAPGSIHVAEPFLPLAA